MVVIVNVFLTKVNRSENTTLLNLNLNAIANAEQVGSGRYVACGACMNCFCLLCDGNYYGWQPYGPTLC